MWISRRCAVRGARCAQLAPLLLALASCELQEVTIPQGTPIVAVQCVLSLDSSAFAQYVVVEHSVTGTVKIPNQDSLRGPPRPPLPISGASVVITRDDGDTLGFAEIPDTAGVYSSPWPRSLPFLLPGRVYRLRVVTPQGDTVTGETRMPEPFQVSGLPPDGATFNRDHDTLALAWTGGRYSKGAYLQVRPRDVAKIVRMVLWTDSSHVRIPGTLPFPLPSDTIAPSVWTAGTRETFTVAAMDTNFFRFFRTANDPFTGSGFANSLTGGIGVFGAMIPVNRTYDVVADRHHPWEGDYRLSGPDFGGIIHLFVDRDAPLPILVAGLVDSTSGFIAPRAESSGSVDGAGIVTLAVVRDVAGEPVHQARLILRGHLDATGTTTGTAVDASGNSHGTFTLTRM